MEPLAKVHADAARLGYIDARTCALPDGLPARTLLDHMRRIGWGPWLPGLWVPSDQEPPYIVRCRMALVHFGSDALLTASSALWALGVLRSEPDDVELLLPAARWVRGRDGICVHYARDHGLIRSGTARKLRISRAARSIAEQARHEGVTPLCRIMADAQRLRHCTMKQIGQEIDRRARFPGRGRARQAHGQLTGELNHSVYERLGRGLLRAARVRVPGCPQPIVHRERAVAEIDIPFFDVRYGVEVDGPPHLLPEQAAKDAARDRMLRRDCDWTIDRFWWFELEQAPQRFVGEVVARLRSLGSAAVDHGVT